MVSVSVAAVTVCALASCLTPGLDAAFAFSTITSAKPPVRSGWRQRRRPVADRPADASRGRIVGGSFRVAEPLRAGRGGGGGGSATSRRKRNRARNPDEGGGGGGFGAAAKKSSKSDIPSGSIYSLPTLYDLAFGYRNYEEEVKFLFRVHRTHSAGVDGGGGGGDAAAPHRILELAAGPARHSVTALQVGSGNVESVTALDNSDDMVSYGREIADETLGTASGGGLRDKFSYVKGDMRDFGPPGGGPIDAVWMLLGSMQHLTTNDDAVSCLRSTSNALRVGGTAVIELPHPRETFSMVECTRNGWEVPLEDDSGEEYGELRIVWGDDDDPFDPIRQVRDFTVSMKLTGTEGTTDEADGEMRSVREVVPMRLYTAQEIDALARLAGMEVAAMYGALSEEVSIQDEDEAFRLVCVLRKV